MPLRSRPFGLLFVAAVSCGAVPLLSQPDATLSPTILITSSMGHPPSVDPLVDPDPFFLLGPTATKDARLTIRPFAFSGIVNLLTDCCQGGGTASNSVQLGVFRSDPDLAVWRGRGTSNAPGLRANQVMLGSLGSASATLRASISNATVFHAGTYRGSVRASADATNAGPYVTFPIAISVVVIPPDNPTPTCGFGRFQSRPDVLSLAPVMGTLFAATEADPSKVHFTIGARAPTHKRGWALTISKNIQNPLSPDQMIVVFSNPTTTTQSMYTVNSSACTGATFGNNIIAPPGHAIPKIISKATASTIVLSDDTTDAIAIFSEPPFWPLFGGRVLHIEAVR